MKARWRRIGLVVASGAAILATGCGERRPGADAQFRDVIAALEAGSLSRAYAEMLPPSYDRDLNEVLRDLRALLSEEDFALLRDLTARAGRKLESALGARAAGSPLLGIVGRAAADLPGLLGLDDYAAFRSRDLRGFLESLDRGLFGELAREEIVRSRLEALEVSIVETKGDWAKLLFRSRGEDGTSKDEVHEVILVEGKWVLNAWAVQWPDQVASWRTAVRDLAEAMGKDPATVRERLKSAEALLDGLPELVEGVLDRISG